MNEANLGFPANRVFGLLLVLSLFAGCGGGPSNGAPSTHPASEYLYAANIGGIAVFLLNPSTGVAGAGRQVSSDFTSVGASSNVISDPAGKFLFVCTLGDSIDVFSIDPTNGALSRVPGSPFPVQGSGVGNLAIVPSGKFLYAASTSGLTAYAVNSSTGVLTAILGSPFTDGSTIRSAVVDPSGKFLYAVGNTTQFTTSIFAIDSASGALAPITGSPFLSPIQSDAFSIVIHPSGKFLYAGASLANDIESWSTAPSTGMLTIVTTSPFVTGNGVTELTITPSGTFLYAINRDDGTVSCFAVDAASGDLTEVNGSPFQLGAGTGSVTIDPSGQFLYAANSAVTVNMIAEFSINAATGALTNFGSFPAEPPILLTIVKPSP